MKNEKDRGLLVVIEGIDGAGKSTLAKTLANLARTEHWQVTLSREPTEGPFGRKIRATATTGRLSPEEEVALFEADRREHVSTLVLPRLKSGELVILDRYYFSSAAYQGARGLSWRQIIQRNEAFAPEPDMLLLLTLPIQESGHRIGHRGVNEDLFESAEYLAKVQDIFLEMEKPYLHRIDAGQSREEVLEKAWKVLKPRLAGS